MRTVLQGKRGRLNGLPLSSRLIFFPVIMLCALDQLIEYHGNHAQDDNGGDDHIELKETAGVGEMDRHGPLPAGSGVYGIPEEQHLQD